MAIDAGTVQATIKLNDEFSGRLDQSQKKLTSTSKRMKQAVAGVTAAMAGLTAGALASARQTAQFRDEVTKSARAAGVGTEAFSEIAFSADRAGIGMEELSRRMTRLAAPTTAVKSELEALGISMEDSNGQARDSQEVFFELSERINNAATEQEKVNLATAAFGDEGGRMVNILDQSQESWAENAEMAARYGHVVTAEAGLAAEKFNDDISTLGDSFGAVSQSLGGAIIEFVNASGILEGMSEVVASVAAWFNDLGEEWQRAILIAGGITAGLVALVAAGTAVIAIAPAMGTAITIAMGPVGAIIVGVAAAIAALVAIGTELVQNWESYRHQFEPVLEIFRSLWNTLMGVVGAIRDALGPALQTASELLSSAFGDETQSRLGIFQRIIAASVTPVIILARGIELLFTNLRNLGEILVDTIILFQQFMTAQAGGMVDTVHRIGANFQEIGESITEIGQKTMDDLAQVWSENDQQAQEAAQETGESVGRSMGEAMGEEAAESAKQSFQKNHDDEAYRSAFERTLQQAASDGGGTGIARGAAELGVQSSEHFQSAIQEAAKSSGQTTGEVMDGVASQIASGVGRVVDGAMDIMSSQFDTAMNNLQNRVNVFDTVSAVVMDRMKKRHQEELDDIKEAEQEKIDAFKETQNAQVEAMREGMNKRLELINEEFAAQKIELERQLEREKEAQQIRFERHLEELRQSAATEEQFLISKELAEQDHKRMIEQIEAEHEERVDEKRQQAAMKEKTEKEQSEQKIREEERKTSEAVAQMEERKNERITKAEEARRKKEKKAEKQAALFRFAIEVAQFQVEQQRARAQAQMSYAQSLMQAVSAGLQFGIAAPAMIPLFTGLATAGFYASMSAIQSTPPPIPPAELFMQEGGTVRGRTHAQGGIPAELEDNETVVSAKLTDKLEDFIDYNGGTAKPDVVINFQAGSFQGVGNMDEKTMDRFAKRIGREMVEKR